MWIFSLDVDHLTPAPLELVGGVLRASWKYRSVTIPLQPRACSRLAVSALCWMRLAQTYSVSWPQALVEKECHEDQRQLGGNETLTRVAFPTSVQPDAADSRSRRLSP